MALVPAPILFILEKVSALIPQDDEVDPGSVADGKEATSSELEGKKEAVIVAEKAEEITAAASSPPSPAGNAPAAATPVAEPTPPETITAKTTVAEPEPPAKA